MNNSSGHIFAATSAGIFRSTNNGDTWTNITDGITHTVWSFTFNSNDDIFASTDGGGVFQSMDNGDNWARIKWGALSSRQDGYR